MDRNTNTNRTKRILVIEDNHELNASLQRKFRSMQLETDGAFNGAEGLTLLHENIYDAIVLDLMMPIKDGFAVMAQLHGTPNKQTPVYVLTSTGEESKIDLAWDLGAKSVFKKEQASPSEVALAVSSSLLSHDSND